MDGVEPRGPVWNRRDFLAGIGVLAAPAVLTSPAHAHPSGAPGRTLVLGCVLHFLDDPGDATDKGPWELFEHGALVVEDGHVAWVGDRHAVPARHRGGAAVVDYGDRLIVPGFVDCHVHYSQVDVIASYGKQLLDWLQTYVFPVESRFGDAAHARAVAGFFLDRLLACGTTTASVFPTVHTESVDAFCAEARRRELRMLCGKVLMDREPFAPSFLRDPDVDTARAQTLELVDRWHGVGRLGYSLTPRFAPSSTEDMLRMVGELRERRPDLWLQTHLAENTAEVELVRELFGGRSYLDVYDRYGLLGPRSIFAHCVHVDDQDRARLAETDSAVAFCPTSNLFLGSGLFDLRRARAAGIAVGLGTDVGAGTSYSILQTLNEAYKVLALQGQPLTGHRGFYLATLGGAQALDLADEIGNLAPGKEADFVVLDWDATPELARRTRVATTFTERLFALMTLGDDRAVHATHVLGRRHRPAPAVPLPAGR